MRKLFFVSRHSLTNGQKATLKSIGFEGCPVNISLGNNPRADIRKAIGYTKQFAIVCPMNIGLELLRKGYTLYEFKNIPSARARRVFICQGVFKHTLAKSEFIQCPLPPEEQEEGSLNDGVRNNSLKR